MKPVTALLSEYICQTKLENLPEAVRHEGVRAFVNWVGCAAGGSHEPDVEMMVDVLSEFNGAGSSVLVGHARRLDAPNAAFINSMSSSALAYNDTHYATVAHPTSPVAAALLAWAARQPMSGAAMLHALILGIEIQCRIGNVLCQPPATSAVGFSMQGLLGTFGAAVALGKFLGLDEKQMAMNIGHAGNQASGVRQAQSSMGSHYTPGHAARCGVMAAIVSKRDFTCCENMIEGPKGFAVSFSTNPNLDAALAGLGTDFELSQLAYKPYPSGFVIHPVIDACLDIAKTHKLAPADIGRIEIVVHPLTIKLTDIVNPRDRGEALVSYQHWTAISLMQGAAGIAQVTDEIVRDPGVAALRAKVKAVPQETMGKEAAEVRVFMRNGETIEARTDRCRGAEGRPLTDDDISAKTLDQLKMHFAADKAERILRDAWRITDSPDAASFANMLSPV